MLAFAPPKEMATQKDSFHNRWRFSQTWNKLQITERTMLMWDLNPNKTRLMQQHDTLRNLLNIIYWIFSRATKWPKTLGFETHCLPPIVHASQGTTRPRQRPKLPQPARYLKPPHPEVGRNWHQDCGAVVCLSFGFVTKQKRHLRRTRRRPGIRPSFVFLLVRFGNIAQDESCACHANTAPATHKMLRLPRNRPHYIRNVPIGSKVRIMSSVDIGIVTV